MAPWEGLKPPIEGILQLYLKEPEFRNSKQFSPFETLLFFFFFLRPSKSTKARVTWPIFEFRSFHLLLRPHAHLSYIISRWIDIFKYRFWVFQMRQQARLIQVKKRNIYEIVTTWLRLRESYLQNRDKPASWISSWNIFDLAIYLVVRKVARSKGGFLDRVFGR